MKKSQLFIFLFVIAGYLTVCSCSNQASTTPQTPQSSEITSTLSYVQVPEAFQGLLAMHSYRTEPIIVEIDLNATLPDVPDHLLACRSVIPDINDSYARKIANSLGFSNEWPLTGTRVVYSFTKENQSLEIDLDGRLSLRQDSKISEAPISLPSDEECIDIARNWLITNNIYPPNITKIEIGYGGISVATINQETGQTSPTKYYSKGVTFTQTLGGYELYANGPYILVGDQGKIIQASIDLTTLEPYGQVKLKTPQNALDLLKQYLEMPPSAQEAQYVCTSNTTGTHIVINKISIRYAKIYNSEFTTPIFVFEGGVLSGNSGQEKFIGKVDAVFH